MQLIIGVDDFGKVMERRLGFIDKSLFIKEILDNESIEASVIVRPRRFGKTLNLSMLYHFLASEVNTLSTKGMFDSLKIAKAGKVYMDQQGKYPVIFVSFKSLQEKTYDENCHLLADLISETYGHHHYLLSSEKLLDYQKEEIEKILRKKEVDSTLLKKALYKLSHYLFEHHGVKPWLLIDEYDTPIQSAYFHGFYDEMIALMRGIFGSALKGNANIHRAVITGILRISKESLFSGVNNLDVYSILSHDYSTCFGFTEAEVDEALKKANFGHLSVDIKAWYNGYHIGEHQIYNPWSIANCINKRGEVRPYWVNTSSNDLIKSSMAQSSVMVKEQFETLLTGQSIQEKISENTVFSDLDKNSDALWSLLLFSGYLTTVKTTPEDDWFNCELRTPNQEVAALYRSVISGWFDGPLGRDEYRVFLTDLITGNVAAFLKRLKRFLKESTSCFDVKGHHPEKFYHGFVLGLMVNLSDTHQVQSNKESGDGRYDVLLIPKDTQKPGLILEFKVADENEPLQKSAEEALEQMTQRRYETELQQKGIEQIIKIGLAFRGKEVEMAWELDPMNPN